MNYPEFLDRVIDEGIVAARADYTKPEQKQKLDGALAGFEVCRGAEPERLAMLLRESAAVRELERRRESLDYWYWRAYEAEIEWVANVVSAMLMNQGLPVIVTPTARGVLKASDIVGISDEEVADA